MNRKTLIKKILILSANPKGTKQLRLDEEKREIEEGLRRAKKRARFRIESADAVRPRDISRTILDFEPQIVHFCGHGAGEEGLVFEDESGQEKLVDAEALAGLFELFAEQVECVVLNACYSEIQAKEIAKHIDYVIGMSQAIEDKAAIEFAVGFYDALGAGREIEFSYKLGCKLIRLAGILNDLIPTLLRKDKLQNQDPIPHTPSETTVEEVVPADELSSNGGIDYTQLRNLIAAEQLREADPKSDSSINHLNNRLERHLIETRACRNAYRWVEKKSEVWAKEALEKTIADYPEFRNSPEQVECLYLGILNCIKWLCTSLSVGHSKVPFDEFVSPSDEDNFPYFRRCFNYLIERIDKNLLSPREVYYIEYFMSRLIDKL